MEAGLWKMIVNEIESGNGVIMSSPAGRYSISETTPPGRFQREFVEKRLALFNDNIQKIDTKYAEALVEGQPEFLVYELREGKVGWSFPVNCSIIRKSAKGRWQKVEQQIRSVYRGK